MIDAGAELVGKTKTSMFADEVDSTCRWCVCCINLDSVVAFNCLSIR